MAIRKKNIYSLKQINKNVLDKGYILEKTALGQLMSDFKATKAADIKNNILAETVRHFKEDEKGIRAMCRIMEEIREEGKTEGKIEGKIEVLYCNLGKSVEEIAALLNIPENEVEKIIDNLE